MNIARQGLSFLVVGCVLVLVDWTVFVVLSALGLPTGWSNIAGRVAGALVGFGANGGVTFKQSGVPKYGVRRFGRFLVLWVVLTLVSTLLVSALADQLSLRVAWVAKPVVDAILAVVSFFISRHWVYV